MSRAQNDNQPAQVCEDMAPSYAAAVDAEAFEIVAGRLASGLIVLCDHAGNAFPHGYGTLGMPASELERHIAYDIGAAGVTRELARRLGCPAVLSRFSRLLIDLNRGLDDPTLIMRLSDGAVVPGNRKLDAAERESRIARFYRPYHDAIERLVDGALEAGRPPLLVAMHSFTNVWKGEQRPWHVGILWDQTDARIARPMIDSLNSRDGLVVGDNEPYRGHLDGDTMWRHGLRRGLPHVLIEVRQDLIRDHAGQISWAERIAGVLMDLPVEFRPSI